MAKPEIYSTLSDEELVHRFGNSHDTIYIGELYQRYTHLVFGVCLKYFRDEEKAKDAVMQIFEKIISDLKKHHVVTFKPWLHTVAKNHCMMQFRQEKSIETKLQAVKREATPVVENEADNHLEEKKDKELMLTLMEKGMTQLKEEQKRCIELFYLQDKSYQQITEETGYSLNDVKSYIQNGKRNLKNYILAKNEQEKDK